MFKRLLTALAEAFGADEAMLLIGLCLITVALWPAFGVAALLLPGLIVTWMALPSRTPFVERTPPSTSVDEDRSRAPAASVVRRS